MTTTADRPSTPSSEAGSSDADSKSKMGFMPNDVDLQAKSKQQHELFNTILNGGLDRNKDVLIESIMLYSPDGKTELIREAKLQFVFPRKYGLVGRNGIGKY